MAESAAAPSSPDASVNPASASAAAASATSGAASAASGTSGAASDVPAASDASSTSPFPGPDWAWQHKTRQGQTWTDYSSHHNKKLNDAYVRKDETVRLGLHLPTGKTTHWCVDLTEMEQKPTKMPAARFKRRLVRCFRKSDGKTLPAIGNGRVLLWRTKGIGGLLREASYFQITADNHLERFADKKRSSKVLASYSLLGCLVEIATKTKLPKHTFPFRIIPPPKSPASDTAVRRSTSKIPLLLAAETAEQRDFWMSSICNAADGNGPLSAPEELYQPIRKTSLWEAGQVRNRTSDVGHKGNRVLGDGTVTGNIFAEIAAGTLEPAGIIPTEGWVGPHDMDPHSLVDANEHVVAFIPLCPAASLHFLVIPRAHNIRDITFLNKSHLQLMQYMRDMGEKLLRQYSPPPPDPSAKQDSPFSFVFHRHKNVSIAYLHLHAIRKPYLSWKNQVKYLPNTMWCATWESVMERIASQRERRHSSDPRTIRLSNSYSAALCSKKELKASSWEFLDLEGNKGNFWTSGVAASPKETAAAATAAATAATATATATAGGVIDDGEGCWTPFNDKLCETLTLLYLSDQPQKMKLKDGSVIDMEAYEYTLRNGKITKIRFRTPPVLE